MFELCLVFFLSGGGSKAEVCSSDSFYIRNYPTNDDVIIFVHGVTGNSRSTWTSDRTGRYWPEMLTQDPTFDRVNVFVYGYDSPRLGQSLTIGELGENLRLVLSSNNIFKHRRVAFLMHSMGGLLVRSFLTEYAREDYIKYIKLLYFLATPTEGSQLSSVFGLVSQNPQFGDMAPADRGNKLGEEIRRWLAARFDIASYCAYETEKTPSGVFGISPVVIVPMTNAVALCNRPADPIPNANHITIAKPDNQEAPQYLAFREAFKREMSAHAAVLKGVVVADEEKGPGMNDVSLSIDEGDADSIRSKDGGKFSFMFPDKQPGETVHVRVNKEGYTVVNDDQLEVTIPANAEAKLLIIIVCKTENREEMARRFYRLKSFEAIEQSYQGRLKELEDTQQATAAALTKLQQERDQAKAQAERTSEELAKNNQGSELYRQAKRLFVDGNVDEAIQVLEDKKLRQSVIKGEKEIAEAIQDWLPKPSCSLLSSVLMKPTTPICRRSTQHRMVLKPISLMPASTRS